MKRYINLILLASAVAGILPGCVMYNDRESVTEPSTGVAKMIYVNAVSPIFRIAELADFYDAYLEIWEDRDASLELASGYFGDAVVNLYYEEVRVHRWGKISKTSIEHVYLAESDWSSLYATYNVTSMGGRKFRIECESSGQETDNWKKFMTDALVSVSDDSIIVENLTINYLDRDDILVSVNGCPEQPLTSVRIAGISNIPAYGYLDFSISGNITDAFAVMFADGSMEIIK
ncbi:MAG: hypothetical protein NC115_06725 [Bacteroidales bacterium]|nr:hypothetical protein [Bacteroidales bacterium]